MRSTWRRALTNLTWTAGLLTLAACGGPAAPSLIRVAHESDVISLDPLLADAASHSILANLCEGLVTFDGEMALRPALAATWSNPDERTWLFELRKGVRFHDGGLVTASVVRSVLERARDDPQAASRRHLATIEAIDVLGADRLVLRTRNPDPLLINRLSWVLIAREPPGPGAWDRVVGTGPYRFVRWDRGRLLEAEAFDGYWGGRPAIDRVQFVPVEEGVRSVQVLERGEVDLLRFVPETLVDRMTAIPGVRVVSRPGIMGYYLWLDPRRAAPGNRNPFSDRRVRQAMSLAIDRKLLVERLGGHGGVSNQLVPKGIFGHIAGLPEPTLDPGKATQILAQAGYAAGFRVTLSHRPQESMGIVARAVQEMLAPLGIRLDVEALDWSELVPRWRAGRLPFFLAGWRFENGDAHSFLVDCVMTRDTGRNLGGNNPGYSNAELDRLIAEHGEIFNETNRLGHYQALTRVIMQEMPLVPLYTRDFLYASAERVAWAPRLDGRLLVAEVSLSR